MTSVNLNYCGAGASLEQARAYLADYEARHARGEHFPRWTGATAGGRRVLGCMFCSRRTLENAS
jgi:hypothetical protein